ncbi:MAG: hypothetical protein SNG10_05880 [Rikenellaceae bacterium]
MGGFTPFKKHATAFKYTPRYYDPLKEEFEKRREELRGERRESSSTQSNEYTPGQYIRTKRMARMESNKQSASKDRRRSSLTLIMIIALLFLFGSMIMPKLIDIWSMSEGGAKVETATQVEEWNPHVPITVVPNDYQGE